MSFKKISELPLASSLDGDELVPIVQDGVTKRAPASGLIPADVVRSDDARLSDPRAPTGDAGGVLSGSYPNPGFAVDMATQSELDAVASALTAHAGTGGASHANAIASGAAGFMTGADKSKLDGIAAGANNYTHPANHPPSIIAQDASNRFVTDAEKAAWNAKEPAISAGTTAQYRRGIRPGNQSLTCQSALPKPLPSPRPLPFTPSC